METFEEYLEALKKRRDEDGYRYTDEQIAEHLDYVIDCWKFNLSVYKCLEWMYFETNRN